MNYPRTYRTIALRTGPNRRSADELEIVKTSHNFTTGPEPGAECQTLIESINMYTS